MREKNSLKALCAAIDNGLGIETDIRDYKGRLVISHDVPSIKSPALDDFLSTAESLAQLRKVKLAFNIKADGLHSQLGAVLKEYGIEKNVFFFDMSIPTLYQFSHGFPRHNLCTRLSEFEPRPALLEKCGWVWVDCFEHDWTDFNYLASIRQRLVLVSPELHGRKHEGFWGKLKKMPNALGKRSFLCTDLPVEARKAFGD